MKKYNCKINPISDSDEIADDEFIRCSLSNLEYTILSFLKHNGNIGEKQFSAIIQNMLDAFTKSLQIPLRELYITDTSTKSLQMQVRESYTKI